MTQPQFDSLVNDPLTDASWARREDQIEAFEQAWRAGPPPRIEDFLVAEGQERDALLVELAHVDLEFRLKAGQPTRVESYLDTYPPLTHDSQIVLDLLTAEYELRRRSDSALELEEYAHRFPAYVDDLRQRLAAASQSTRDAATSHTKAVAPQPPTVPGFEILGEIGRGGMGIIYKARQQRLKRHVALKFLPADLIAEKTLLDRFLREAVTASALNHPNICTVHELGEHAGRPFIVMEFIAGETLQALAARRPSVAEVCRLMREAARALAAAHAAGVVHRDIKPENIMVRGDGYVKVLDFGLARRLPTLTQHDTWGANDTSPGALLGTIAYMSPEQARGEPVDSPSDIFSLGVVFYRLITGRHPFECDSAYSTLHAIAAERPIAPSRLNADIPRDLSGLIEAMLSKEAGLRPSALAVEQALASSAPSRQKVIAAAPPSRPIVHRQPELAALRAAMAAAEAGTGRFICIAGEPGIGKTTLVEDFLAELVAADRPCVVARGRCTERQAGTEAFLPILETLNDLVGSDATGSASRLMNVLAPTWHDQLKRGTRTSETELPRAASQHAMLREFCNLLDELSRLSPVVLFFDDLHWADLSTVDLLAHFGRHCQSQRLLVIVTFRTTEMLLGPHPFHRVKLDLQAQGACHEVAVGFLGRGDIDNYLSLVFPGHSFGEDFANLVFSRTEGSPLFMADMLGYLREQGVIHDSSGRWALAKELPDLRRDLPQSVRSMIERKFEQLTDDDRRLLQAAAVQGYEFDSDTITFAINRHATAVEDRLQILERVHRVVRLLGESEFPDRTPTLRYVFVHVLYQHALLAEIGPSRRASLSLALANSLERHHAGHGTAAAEIACLYETGRECGKAAMHFQLAAQNAAKVFAHQDAIALAQRGLRQLEAVSPSPQRDELELPLQMTLGLQLQITEGYAADQAKQAYDRARELCPAAEHSKRLFTILWGQWLYYKVRSRLLRAQEMAEELVALAKSLNDPDLALQAHQSLGITAFCRGNPTAALRHVEQVTSLYNPDLHSDHAALFGQDPAVICKAFGSIVLWLLGFPDAARRQSESAIDMSRQLSPTSQSVALHFAAMLHQLCRDPHDTRRYADASAQIATEHGLSFWLAGSAIMSGWSLAALGHADEGIGQLRQGLLDWQATGSATYRTYYLALLADSLANAGQVAAAHAALDDALALVDRTDERFFEAEIHRCRGELHLRSNQPGRDSASAAQSAFHRAIDISSRQEARSLSLRAHSSLVRLESASGQSAETYVLLANTLTTFTQGLDTPDLVDAQALLEHITRPN